MIGTPSYASKARRNPAICDSIDSASHAEIRMSMNANPEPPLASASNDPAYGAFFFFLVEEELGDQGGGKFIPLEISKTKICHPRVCKTNNKTQHARVVGRRS